MQPLSGICRPFWRNFKEVNNPSRKIDPNVHYQPLLLVFFPDQSSELAQALKRSQTELASALQESHQLKGEVEELRARLVEANGAAEAAAILNQELEDGEKKVAEFTRESKLTHVT